MSIELSNQTLSDLMDVCKDITVLYVEDDPLIRAQYKIFLDKIFLSVVVCEDGEIGLSKAEDMDYDIVVSDLQMPKLNGLEMIKKIKQNKPEQVSVVISAHKDICFLHDAISAGVDGYLFKPMDLSQAVNLFYKIATKINISRENNNYKLHLEEMVESKTQEIINSYAIDAVTNLFSFGKLEADLKIHKEIILVEFKVHDFKSINNVYGYDIGDEVLQDIALFLKHEITYSFGESVIGIYRLSGAHFAVLLDISSKYKIDELVGGIVDRFDVSTFFVKNEAVFLELYAGVAHYDKELLIPHANAAVRESKKSGLVVIYEDSPKQIEHNLKALKCKSMLKTALLNEGIVAYYQPIVTNSSGRVEKYEALVRLLDGESVLTPIHFLPVSKDTKMYSLITQHMVKTALRDFEDSSCSVSINLSVDDIEHPKTAEFILREVAKFPDPSRLVFEILESEEIISYDAVFTFLSRLKHLGCLVAIDDFGSGYSNFEHLAKLNVDYLKIDGSLIQKLQTDYSSQVIVETIVSFAKKSGIKTIAEFVSSAAIANIVQSLGVDESQGYFFGQPKPYSASLQCSNKYGASDA